MEVNRRQFLKKAALGILAIPFLKMDNVETALKKIELPKPETPAPLNKDNILECISNAKHILDEQNIPEMDRWLVFPEEWAADAGKAMAERID